MEGSSTMGQWGVWDVFKKCSCEEKHDSGRLNSETEETKICSTSVNNVCKCFTGRKENQTNRTEALSNRPTNISQMFNTSWIQHNSINLKNILTLFAPFTWENRERLKTILTRLSDFIWSQTIKRISEILELRKLQLFLCRLIRKGFIRLVLLDRKSL